MSRAPVDSHADSEWLLRVLGLVARSIMQGNYRHLSPDDLVSAGAIAYLNGVERYGIQDRPVNERFRILRQRIRGAMFDEIRKVNHNRPADNQPLQMVTLKETDIEWVESTEDQTLRIISSQEAGALINETLRLASSRQRDRDWYVLWKGWGVKLREISKAYGVTEGRVSQVCSAIQTQVDEINCLTTG